MIRLAALAAWQALAFLAGPAVLAPAALLSAAAIAITREGLKRIRLGALFFAAMFAATALMTWLERALIQGPAPDLARLSLLSLRGFASFCGAVAATCVFTLAEALVFLKRLGAPDHVVTLAYLMAQDFGILARLASEVSLSIRSRIAGAPLRRRLRLLSGAAGNFLTLTADKYRERHEHIQARGLGFALPLEAWRSRERLYRG